MTDESPIVRRTPSERVAYLQGVLAGGRIALKMVDTAFGERYASRVRPDFEAYVDLINDTIEEPHL